MEHQSNDPGLEAAPAGGVGPRASAVPSACPLCGTHDAFTLQRSLPLTADAALVKATLSAPGDVVRFEACQRCGLLFRTPRPTPEHLTHYYTTILPLREAGIMGRLGVTHADAARRNERRYRRLFEDLSPLHHGGPGHVVDIGGWDGRALLPWRDHGWHTTLIEPGANDRVLASPDIRTFGSVRDALAGGLPPADVVTSYHCVEHLLDVRDWLLDARGLSKRGTLWVVEVPLEVTTMRGLFGPTPLAKVPIHEEHLNFFTPASLAYLAEAMGLRTIQLGIVVTAYWYGATVALRLVARDESGAPAPARLPAPRYRSALAMRAELMFRVPVWRRIAGVKYRYFRWRNRDT